MDNERIKIAIAGDCSNWNQRSVNRGDIPLEIRDKIQECDVFIFNLEGPIITNRMAAKGAITNNFVKKILDRCGKLQPIVINTENLLDVLNLTKKNVSCLANNHILDAGGDGVDSTLKFLGKKRFLSLGAGRDLNEASKPLIIEVKGKKIGVLNYNFIGWRKIGLFINIFGASKKRPGANYAKEQKIMKDIQNLSKQVDYIIVVMHIGKELHEKLLHKEQYFLESLETDLIVTHHAHITQLMKSENVVSCGDFIFNYPEHLHENRPSEIVIFDLIGSTKKIIKTELMIKRGMPCVKPN